jgi:hypothetical protein
MREVCFCDRFGDARGREPILGDDGRWALRCRSCGHLDSLERLPEEARLVLWDEAKRRREELVIHE